jgi:hypothetical protein
MATATITVTPPPPPSISSVSPDMVTGSNSPQPFTINGTNFVTGANIFLRDKTTGEVFANRVASSFTSTQIVINPNFHHGGARLVGGSDQSGRAKLGPVPIQGYRAACSRDQQREPEPGDGVQEPAAVHDQRSQFCDRGQCNFAGFDRRADLSESRGELIQQHADCDQPDLYQGAARLVGGSDQSGRAKLGSVHL